MFVEVGVSHSATNEVSHDVVNSARSPKERTELDEHHATKLRIAQCNSST